MEPTEYVQISILNYKNLMPETMLSLPQMMASLGYSLTGTDDIGWHFEFIFDYHDPKAEPSNDQIEKWLALRYFDVIIERYEV